jgi:hypothetical protein
MNAEPLWYWMRERHNIYLRRQAGQPWPWTLDPILREYRFCNVFRELDTVTEWVRKNWREPYADHPNLWFAMAVARQINWPDTLAAIQFPHLPADSMHVWFANAKAAMWARQHKQLKVYTGAYMLRGDIQRVRMGPSNAPHSNDKPTYTLDTVLRYPWENQRELLQLLIRSQCSLQDVHTWFTKWPGWGGFLAYEVVTDLRQTRYLERAPDIMTWANAGPGAVRGLNRIHGRPVKQVLSQAQANTEMRTLLTQSWANLPKDFPPLEMRDIEHSLCEMDKWCRVQEGSGRPRARYQPPKG